MPLTLAVWIVKFSRSISLSIGLIRDDLATASFLARTSLFLILMLAFIFQYLLLVSLIELLHLLFHLNTSLFNAASNGVAHGA